MLTFLLPKPSIFSSSESDKARKLVIEEANKALSVSGETSKALSEFKEQVDAKEAEELQVKIKELEELAAKAQNGDEEITADSLREKIDSVQQASLGLFKKVYEKRAQETSDAEKPKEENKEGGEKKE